MTCRGRQIRGALIACLALAVFVPGCGSSQGEDTTTTGAGQGPQVLTIEEALLAERGSTVDVRGALVAPNGGSVSEMVLASVLLESYPPQAAGATLRLSGLDLEDLVGLSSTSDGSGLAQVWWSDYWMVLGGVIKDGLLEVQQTPRIVTATAAGVTVRFSPVAEPMVSGDTVWWAFDLRNQGSTPMELQFSSGQHAEIVLAQDGVEKYRWSGGRAFTQAIENVTIKPGETWPVVVNDSLTVPPGDYDLTATITAGVGGEGSGYSPGAALPPLTTTVRVY